MRQAEADAWWNALSAERRAELEREHATWLDRNGCIIPNTPRGIRLKAFASECPGLPLETLETLPKKHACRQKYVHTNEKPRGKKSRPPETPEDLHALS